MAAWVYRIARNVLNDHYRKSSREQSLRESESLPEAAEEDSLCQRANAWLVT